MLRRLVPLLAAPLLMVGLAAAPAHADPADEITSILSRLGSTFSTQTDRGVDSPAVAPTDGSAVEQAKAAIGAGDGATAATLIRNNQLAGDPQVLAELIYGGGVIAVRDGKFDEFTFAVADAFVDGGVSFLDAQQAFVHAAVLVATNAGNDPQILQELLPGGVAILRTELAYGSLSLPPLPIYLAGFLPKLPLPLQGF